MKLENKISLQFIIILLTIGGILFITGLTVSPFFIITVHALFNIPYGLLTYFLFLLPFVGVFIVLGLFIGRKIRKPLFFILRWIDNLADGIFEKPPTKNDFTLKRIKFSIFLELESKLSGLTDQLKWAERERKELEESRRNWTRSVTHDLKTPLSYIKGYATMLRSEHTWETEEVKEFAQIIEDKSLHMERLINDLSVVYEFDKGEIPLNLRTMPLIPFVADVLADLEQHPTAKEYHLQLNTRDQQNIKLSFDAKLLKRALDNLIMNAILHNAPGTTVTVTVGTKEDAIFIEIKDDGTGMDEKTVGQLFDRYYRGTPTDKTALGSGLGMLIAKQFVERLDGVIEVDSEPGHGTTITLLFHQEN